MLKRFLKNWWPYLAFGLVYLVLSVTGTRAEAFGFIQRGLLSTGLMQAKVSETPEDAEIKLSQRDWNLQLIDADGRLHSLSEFKNKAVFINLWATWCPPCIAEMPSIENLYQKTNSEVGFIMISRDRDFKLAKAFVKRKGYNFPIYYALEPMPVALASTAIPSTFVIAPTGRLAYKHQGMANYNDPEIERFLLELK